MKKIAFLFLSLFSVYVSARDTEFLDEIHQWADEVMKDLPDPGKLEGFDHLNDERFSDENIEAYAEELAKAAREGNWTEEAKEFVELSKSVQIEKIDGDEAMFRPEILKDPKKELGIVSSQYVEGGIESILRTCQESGEYEAMFVQKLVTKLVPQPMKKVKVCSGHIEVQVGKTQEKELDKHKKVPKEKREKIKEKFMATGEITGINVHATPGHHINTIAIAVLADYWHKENVGSCDHYHEINEPIAPIPEKKWEELPAEYFALDKNPHCRKAVYDVNPETRNIIFHCGPDDHSPCVKLWKEGGILVKKECLKEYKDTGKCELWEKTYEFGKIREGQIVNTFEEGKTIWGLNDEFSKKNPESPKDNDFYQAFAALKVISDMPLGESTKTLLQDFTKKSEIFNGVKHTCRCNHTFNEWDCCEHMTSPGGKCEKEDFELREIRNEGRCHKVGSYEDEGLLAGFVGFDKTKVFCCYPTKLLRIFNEKARDAMWGGDEEAKWGTAKKPKCHGFSLESMEGKVSLSTMDFSEVTHEFEIDEAAITKEIQERLRASATNPENKNIFNEALNGPK